MHSISSVGSGENAKGCFQFHEPELSLPSTHKPSHRGAWKFVGPPPPHSSQLWRTTRGGGGGSTTTGASPIPAHL